MQNYIEIVFRPKDLFKEESRNIMYEDIYGEL